MRKMLAASSPTWKGRAYLNDLQFLGYGNNSPDMRSYTTRSVDTRMSPLGLEVVLTSVKNESKRLYFGRDPLGRRSLLIHKPTSAFPVFILCSVSARVPEGLKFEELSSDYLFSLDLGILRGPDNVRLAFFRSGHPLLMIQKAGHGVCKGV